MYGIFSPYFMSTNYLLFFYDYLGLADIGSFMLITGTKTDIWLVKTVSVLLLAVSFYFIAHLIIKTNQLPAIVLTATCCFSLACIDFYYTAMKIISSVYFIDGIVQLILLTAWVIIASDKRK